MIRPDQLNLAEILAVIYPVGSVYINADVDTDPSTLLGFGTWSAVGSGRVLVGQDTGDTDFDTLGETGGEKVHTLTESEMPSHTHSQNSHNHSQNSHYHSTPNHTHEIRYKNFTGLSASTAGYNLDRTVNAGDSYDGTSAAALATAPNTGGTTATNNATTATNNNTGGGASHNNLQPYVVVKMWKRTA